MPPHIPDPPPLPCLDGLPFEVLFKICEYADTETLKALALTRRHYYHAVVAPQVQLYRNIKIDANDLAAIQLVNGSPKVWGAQNVRQLTIVDDDHLLQNLTLKFYPAYWTPLISLLQAFTSLADLIWQCPLPVPLQVLRVLYQDLPSCGLHLRNFRFACPSQAFNMANADYGILASPNLRSIWFRYPSPRAVRGHTKPDYTLDNVGTAIHYLAPNLRQLRAIEEASVVPWPKELDEAWEAWAAREYMGEYYDQPSVLEAEIADRETCSVRELELIFNGGRMTSAIRPWTSTVNFSLLQRLVVRTDTAFATYLVTLNLMRHAWHGGKVRFGALNSLSLCLTSSTPFAHDFLVRFFGRLPPLSSLELTLGGMSPGYEDRSKLAAIIKLHAPTLKTLHLRVQWEGSLRSGSGGEDLMAAIASCVSLEDLAIRFRRTQGNTDEVAVYKTLGSLPKLRKLELLLDVWPTIFEAPDEPDPSYDNFDRRVFAGWTTIYQPTNGLIREVLINSAIDKELAVSIFETINAAKPEEAWPLEELDLVPVRGEGRPSSWFTDTFVTYMGSSAWNVKLSNLKGSCVAVARAAPRCGRALRLGGRLDAKIRPILRRLWPAKDGDNGRRDDWNSWPLAK